MAIGLALLPQVQIIGAIPAPPTRTLMAIGSGLLPLAQTIGATPTLPTKTLMAIKLVLQPLPPILMVAQRQPETPTVEPSAPALLPTGDGK